MSARAEDLTMPWLGGGELATLTRCFDWSKTAAGPIERWSLPLRNTVATMLSCRQPMFLWWGPELVQFYNDAYRPSLGNDRHPAALGGRGRAFWADIWDTIGPLVDRVRAGGQAYWAEDQRIPILRDGGFQEVFWTFSYSPVHDEAGHVAGVLVVCNETTQKVVGERRLRIYKDLAIRAVEAEDERAAAEAAIAVLGEHADDVPFSALYLGGPDSAALELAAVHGLEGASVQAPRELSPTEDGLGAPTWRAIRSGEPVWVDDVQQRVPGLTGGPWPEPIRSACVMPLRGPHGEGVRGALVMGASARLPLGPSYRDFFQLVAAQTGELVTRAGGRRQLREMLVREQQARLHAEEEVERRTEAELARAQMFEEAEWARAQAEAERTRLRNFFHSAPAVLCTLRGPDHVFELVNPLYQRIVGGPRRLQGLPIGVALPEVVSQGFIELLDKVYRTGEPFVGRELPIALDRHGSGKLEQAYFTFNYQARRGPTGEIEGIDVFAFEVTEQVLARRDAEARAGFEQQLIGIVSHDLRNPLSGILLAAQALLRRSHELDERTATQAARIQVSAERAARLVRDLLDFTQARLGDGVPVVPRPLDLHQLARQSLDELRAAFPERELRLEQEGDAHGEWDADRLGQVLSNLVTNAVKYGQPGGAITVRTRREADGVSIAVHNLGTPIPPDRLASIFQPLHRGERHGLRDAERSVGLGLYIVEQVAKAHGGAVEVRSTAEEGTTFTVRLPWAVPRR